MPSHWNGHCMAEVIKSVQPELSDAEVQEMFASPLETAMMWKLDCMQRIAG